MNFSIVIEDIDNSFEQSTCIVKLNKDTYQRLFNGESTFELEARINNIELSGNTYLLRDFGKSLRNSN
jgi:hypothetical protein